MINLYVTTMLGLTGSHFQYAPSNGEECVAIRFSVKAPVVYSEKQSFAYVSDIAHRARLDWIEPHSGQWHINLDKLSEYVRQLRDLPWCKGWAKVHPKVEFRTALPPPIFPLGSAPRIYPKDT